MTKMRKQNSKARDEFSLACFGPRSNAMLVKITPDPEPRKNRPGRGGRELENKPMTLDELEERYAKLLCYLIIHGVRVEDIKRRPASYIPYPSKKYVIYAYIVNDDRAIDQLGLQCYRQYGLHAYREGEGKEVPPELEEAITS